MIREYAFEARSRNGQAEKSTVVADGPADAREQLTRMGYTDIRIIGSEAEAPPADPTFYPAIFTPAAHDSLARIMLKTVRHSWLLLVPGVLALIVSAWRGYPLLWGAGILLAGLAVAAMRAAPEWLYRQMQWAQVNGNYKRGLASLRLLGILNPGRRLSEMTLDGEKAKLLAAMGKLEQALDEYFIHAEHPQHVLYLSTLGSIYGAAGKYDKMIAAQREALVASEYSVGMRIDLAFTLVRYTTSYDEVRTLISGIDERGCSEVFIRGLRTVEALLAQSGGMHDQAIASLRAIHDELKRFDMPLYVGLRAELVAYIALSMKAQGLREADALWYQAWEVLQHHHVDLLVSRYEAAGVADGATLIGPT